MRSSIDSRGRVVIPKRLRDALGLVPGSEVEISRRGEGLQLDPRGRSARLVEESARLVVTGDTTINDDDVRRLVDAGRR